MTKYDAIVIGAGHNGLIAAPILLRLAIRHCSRWQSITGGCASSKPWAGITFQIVRSGSLSWIQRSCDLKLGQHGLSLGEAKATIALQADGDHLTIKGDQVSGAASRRPIKRRSELQTQIQTFTALMNKAYQARAPKLVDHNWTDRITLMKLGLASSSWGGPTCRT